MAKCSIFSEIEGKFSLKRKILPKGLENMVPHNEWSHLRESHLSRAFYPG